ncbi:MAG: MAPEG family protein [Hyphomicrobiales bacterium]
MESASTELRYLLYVILLGLLVWIPYILAEIATNGIARAFSYPDERNRPLWAQRLAKAHQNLLENTVPFAAIVLAGEAMNVHTPVTAACAMVFFWARVAHPFTQITRIWGARTLAFGAGYGATLVYLLTLLGA